MTEDLDLDQASGRALDLLLLDLLRDLLDLAETELAAQHDGVGKHGVELQGLDVGHVDLGGDVNLHSLLSRRGDDGLVHGDDRGDVRLFGLFDERLDDAQVMVVNDGVEGQVGPDLLRLATVGDLLQVVQGEIDRSPGPHVELLHPEVHRIGTVVKRGLQGLEIPGRRHQFDLALAVHYHDVNFSELQKYDIFHKPASV